MLNLLLLRRVTAYPYLVIIVTFTQFLKIFDLQLHASKGLQGCIKDREFL